MESPAEEKTNPKTIRLEEEDLLIHKWDDFYLARHHSFPWNFYHYCACGYVGGSIYGGVKGLRAALVADDMRSGESFKQRMNRALDSRERVGRRYGDSIGGWGLLYGVLEGYVGYYRGVDDALNSFVAGFTTASLYKYSRCGLRAAVVGGVIGGMGAASVVTALKLLLS